MAIGETNMFIKKVGESNQIQISSNANPSLSAAKKDDDGMVIIGPRNFTTKKGKKGKDESVYF